MKKLILLIFCTVFLTAEIELLDSLKTRAIGAGGERVIIGSGSARNDKSDPVSQAAAISKNPTISKEPTVSNKRLQACYDNVYKTVQRAYRANSSNNPAGNIAIVPLDSATKCTKRNKACAQKAWEAGKRCFESRHTGMTPVQIAHKCNVISDIHHPHKLKRI